MDADPLMQMHKTFTGNSTTSLHFCHEAMREKSASCTAQQASHSAVAKLSENHKVFRLGTGLVWMKPLTRGYDLEPVTWESNGHFQITTYSFVSLILGLCIMKDHVHCERFLTLRTRKANRSWESKCSYGTIWTLKKTNPTKISLCFLFLLFQAWVMWDNRTQRCRKKYYIKWHLMVWAKQKQSGSLVRKNPASFCCCATEVPIRTQDFPKSTQRRRRYLRRYLPSLLAFLEIPQYHVHPSVLAAQVVQVDQGSLGHHEDLSLCLLTQLDQGDQAVHGFLGFLYHLGNTEEWNFI